MKVALAGLQICLLVLVLAPVGCEPGAAVDEPPSKVDTAPDVSVYAGYAPEKIDITPLTEIVRLGDAEDGSKIDVYVNLLDSFGSQIKSPGTFRFELYEHVQRSALPKGRRAVIWPDIDVTGAAENNRYWRDFLRTYQFTLDFEPERDRTYVLQLTFISLDGKRLSDEIVLKGTK